MHVWLLYPGPDSLTLEHHLGSHFPKVAMQLSSLSGSISFLHLSGSLIWILIWVLIWKSTKYLTSVEKYWVGVRQFSKIVPMKSMVWSKLRCGQEGQSLPFYSHSGLTLCIHCPKCSLLILQPWNPTHSSKTHIEKTPSGSSPEYFNPTHFSS